MATGDDKVDEQHRVLIDMINGLIQAMQKAAGVSNSMNCLLGSSASYR
ncbi:MAG: hypothetical protein R2856_09740 [Caldilineaceae bacterium]